VVTESGKGSGRVAVAGLACLKPEARSHLSCRMRIHRGRKGERRSMSEADYAGLITAAHHKLQNPWTGLKKPVQYRTARQRVVIKDSLHRWLHGGRGYDLAESCQAEYSCIVCARADIRFCRHEVHQ